MIETETHEPDEGSGTNSEPAAVIYTHALLEGSMTFIKSHAEALTKYIPVYAGSHRASGIELPDDRTYVLNEGTPAGYLREAIFRSRGWAPGLVRKLKSHGPQVVHVHFGTCGPAGMALADKLQIPLVVTFHGQDATKRREEAVKSHRGRELLRNKDRMIETAGAFIAVSDYIRQRLLEQGYPDEKIILHRNGIDLDFFSPRTNQPREPIVMFVGRFVEKKGIPYLIEAAQILRDQGTRFELVLIGGGPLEAELKEAAAEAGIPCRFEGFLHVREVRNWLEKASVVAVPSVVAANGDSEGLPTILLEAQAMAVPIVATRHSGIPEGVIDGATAEIIEERDTAALAEKLRSFLESPDMVRAYGEAGRQFVSENFDIRTQAAGLEDIYADAFTRYDRGK